MVCRITRSSCDIRITIVIIVIDLIIELLIACYVMDRFFIITFDGVCVDLIDICLRRFWCLWLWLFKYTTLLCVVSCNSTVSAFLNICRANLTVVMIPALTTVYGNASVLVLLGNSLVASEVLARLLVICVAIAFLKIIDNIGWLSVSFKLWFTFCCFCATLKVYRNLKGFGWRYCFFQKLSLSVMISHVEYKSISN